MCIRTATLKPPLGTGGRWNLATHDLAHQGLGWVQANQQTIRSTRKEAPDSHGRKRGCDTEP
jgi:hypothetical protein